MRKAFILVMLSMGLTGCVISPKPYIPPRPYVITSKAFPYLNSKKSHVSMYKYVDGNGKEWWFEDYGSLYHIGDTLK